MIRVNLLSPGKKEIGAGAAQAGMVEEEKEAKLNMGAVIGAVILTVGVAGYLYITQSQELTRKKRELNEKKARIAELENVLKTVEQLEATKKKLDRKVKLIQDLKNRQHTAVMMMDEISKALPDMVWLTKLTFTDNLVVLEGRATTNDLVADFINNLKASDHFFGEKFSGSNRRKQGGIEIFSFKFSIFFSKEIIKQKVI